MLWLVFALLIFLWLLGIAGGIGGSLIHLLLVAAIIVFLLEMFRGTGDL
jgi:Family of unknown function (DUF5670)